MKRLLIAVATFALHSASQAELVEGNVTLQLKMTRQAIDVYTPTSVTKKQVVTSFKNADFIELMNKFNPTEFSKSAKLMYSILGEESPRFFIRDNGVDFSVSAYFYFGSGFDVSPVPSAIATGKLTTTIPTLGSQKITSLGSLVIASTTPEVEDLEVHGSLIQTERYVRSKESTERSVAILTGTVTGFGQFYFPMPGAETDRGLVEGTVKFTAGKVFPSPAP